MLLAVDIFNNSTIEYIKILRCCTVKIDFRKIEPETPYFSLIIVKMMGIQRISRLLLG